MKMYMWEKQTVYFSKRCTNTKDLAESTSEILFKLKKIVCMQWDCFLKALRDKRTPKAGCLDY